MDANRAEVRAWVEQALATTGETASGLARKAGLATTTLTRFLADDGSPMLGLRSITKIAHAAGLPPPFAVPEGRARDDHDDAVPFVAAAKSPHAAAVAALTAGKNGVDAWEVRTRALEQRGLLIGDVVLIDLSARPAAGNIVCCQCFRWAEGVSGTLLRVYEPPYLVAAAMDLSLANVLRRPLLVDNETVIIKGVVTACLRLMMLAA